MSRARLSYVLAFFGILITTGGCADLATAPEAASVEVSQNRSKSPVKGDSVVTTPETTSDDDATISGGVILVGGGRSN